MDEWTEAHLDLLQNKVRASVRRHGKIHGRRSYLDFIIHFV